MVATSHPVFVALKGTAERYELPQVLFDDLITAFEQDQTVTRYQNFEALFHYCRYSANPVGRLVLGLCGYRDAERQALSDIPAPRCNSLISGRMSLWIWKRIASIFRWILPGERHGYSVESLFARRFDGELSRWL